MVWVLLQEGVVAVTTPFWSFSVAVGLLILAVSSALLGGDDPNHNQGPLASLVKDLKKPQAATPE